MQDKKPRTKKLVYPSFQLRLIGKFVGLSALALVLQFLLLGILLTNSVRSFENSTDLFEQIPQIVLKTLSFSILVLLPIIFGLGVMLTHKIAGPVYRFEAYLKLLAQGEHTGPCKTRDGDELDSLRDAINEAAAYVDTLKGEGKSADQGEEAPAVRKAG